MKRTFLSFFCLVMAAVSLFADTKVYNCYGMKLREKDGSYVVSGIKAYKSFGIDVRTLPDVNTPYKPRYSCLDKSTYETVETEDMVYKTGKTGEELHLIMYKANVANAPIVFFIHGGGWTAGKYTTTPKYFKTMAGKYGITVVSIEYTFATVPGARAEDTIQDCYDAVDFILNDARKYDINPKRVGFVGSSAGGHLSAMCALHFPQTKAYVGWYGAYDMVYTMGIYAPASNESRYNLLKSYFNDWDMEYVKSVSPVEVARSMKKIPFKAVLFAGTADITIGYQNAPNFAAALKVGGVKKVEVETYPNVVHGMFRAYCGNEIYQKTLNFFAGNL